jgi:uncharacterized protein Yka (UPF0111/DUF47 family)
MFKSKEISFFDLFVESARATHNAALKLEKLTDNYTNIAAQVREIEEIEHECDQHVHKILAQLNKSFITPIDRDDPSCGSPGQFGRGSLKISRGSISARSDWPH